MAEYLIICPTTKKLVHTGQKVERNNKKKGLFDRLLDPQRKLPPEFRQPGYLSDTAAYTFKCSACGQEHNWHKADAFIGSSG